LKDEIKTGMSSQKNDMTKFVFLILDCSTKMEDSLI